MYTFDYEVFETLLVGTQTKISVIYNLQARSSSLLFKFVVALHHVTRKANESAAHKKNYKMLLQAENVTRDKSEKYRGK